ncbi:MAG: UDP-N-acetylglucosamine transferase subunit [Icmadophila ericetorum]|nr:UDP-N-acetylglucosamine transferase subunit [Icmadophila ericetorum]
MWSPTVTGLSSTSLLILLVGHTHSRTPPPSGEKSEKADLSTLIQIEAFIILFLTFLFVRLLFPPPTQPPTPRRRGSPTHLLVVLGSGGHTAEMLSLIRDLDTKSYMHRTYVVCLGDDFSSGKAEEFERGLLAREMVKEMEMLGEESESDSDDEDREVDSWESSGEEEIEEVVSDGAKGRELPSEKKEGREKEDEDDEEEEDEEQDTYGTYTVHLIPRARYIHQPLVTAPITSLFTLISCLHLLTSPQILPSHAHPGTPRFPDLILTNGPATATILLLSAKILKVLGSWGFPGLGGTKGKMRSIYVESWARVKGLSLSGKIVLRAGLADRVLGQWEGLKGPMEGNWDWSWGRKREVEFRGVLVE